MTWPNRTSFELRAAIATRIFGLAIPIAALWVVVTPAHAEQVVYSEEGVDIVAAEAWCKESVEFEARSDDPDAFNPDFGGEALDVMRGTPPVMRLFCPQAKQVTFEGKFNGETVYRGRSSAAGGWKLVSAQASSNRNAEKIEDDEPGELEGQQQQQVERKIAARSAGTKQAPLQNRQILEFAMRKHFEQRQAQAKEVEEQEDEDDGVWETEGEDLDWEALGKDIAAARVESQEVERANAAKAEEERRSRARELVEQRKVEAAAARRTPTPPDAESTTQIAGATQRKESVFNPVVYEHGEFKLVADRELDDIRFVGGKLFFRHSKGNGVTDGSIQGTIMNLGVGGKYVGTAGGLAYFRAVVTPPGPLW